VTKYKQYLVCKIKERTIFKNTIGKKAYLDTKYMINKAVVIVYTSTIHN
jgi:hypothetical protein